MQKKCILTIFIFVILTFNFYTQNVRMIQNQTRNEKATFEILIDDHTLGPNVKILSIEVKGKLKDISIADIKFLYHSSNPDFVLVNKKIAILLGYQNQNDTIFKGNIVQHDIEQKPVGPVIMTIEAEGQTQESNNPNPAINLQKGANIISYKFKIKENIKMNAEILITGTNSVKLGNKIEMKGFGVSFDGIYKVVSIKHKLKAGNWKTRLGMNK